MTIKELAEFTGKNKSTIGRWVAKCNSYISDRLQNATKDNPVDFTIDEVEEILKAGSMSKDAVRILMENARQPVLQMEVTQSNNMDMKLFADMMAQSLAIALKPIYDRLDSVEKSKPLQIEHVPEMPTRALFRKYIDKLVKVSKSDWSSTYNAVYTEMGYIYNVKVKARAKNRDLKCIDVLEQDGLLGKAIAITRQMIERLELTK